MDKQDEKEQDGLLAQDEMLKNDNGTVPAEAPAEETAPAEIPPAAEETAPAEIPPAAEESAPAEKDVPAAQEPAKKTKKIKKQKSGKNHGRKIAIITVSSILALIILTVSLLLGIGSCNKSGFITPPEFNTTLRKELPTDGSTPEDHIALDNIAYMAYVLDNQPYYHAYANNSTKSTGYEQITQTWKDYRVQDVDGKSRKIMVCSDLSYSALVKSASQTCFVDNTAAYMRTGSKPAKQSLATDIDWSADSPKKYVKEDYLKTYGEFSTELSVYVINESTVESAGEVVNNGDGTYSQTFSLNSGAACWYQYGMKTRGSLKTFPEFQKIEITFTFDGKWQVLSTYCEEKASIAPAALGGIPMGSNSKTTTTWDYSEPDFDTEHYGYFDSYFKGYLDKELGGSENGGDTVSLTDVLMGGFGKVISNSGQQFALELNLGENVYDGKIYLKLVDLGDVLGTLEVRLALEKRGSGKQDLYAEFSGGAVNVYYSDGFALTADIDKVSSSVGAFSAWINSISVKGDGNTDAPAAQADGGFDLSSLMNDLKVEPEKLAPEDTEVKISLVTDDLLGLGIGVNLEMNFSRSVSEDGLNVYEFKDLKLDGLSFKAEGIDLSGAVVPDETEVITRKPAETAADIADYIDGVLALVKSKSYLINLSLDGTAGGVDLINGLKLDATVQVELSSDFRSIRVNLPLSVDYKNISARLSVYYTVNLESGGYGKVYIDLTNVCGRDVNAKVCCDIGEVITSVNRLLSMFAAPEPQAPVTDGYEQNALTVAEIINTVLNLDFGAIVTELKADENEIKVSVNADEILKTVLTVLNKQFDIELGTATLTVALNDGIVSLGGTVSALGLNLGINGSDEAVPEINTDGYADVTKYVDGVYYLLNSNTYEINLSLDGSCTAIEYLSGVTAEATAYVKLNGGYKNIEVSVPEITVNYQGLKAVLGVYYTVNLDDGGYGKVYVSLSELGGKEINAKIYCDVADAVEAVTALIKSFRVGEEAPAAVYAGVIDTVLSIDFGAIITEIKISEEEIKLGADINEILKAMNVSLGMDFGEVSLTLGLTDGVARLDGLLPSFGLTLAVSGSEAEITAPDESEYADANAYIDGVAKLLAGGTFAVSVNLDGTCNSIEYIKGVSLTANALVKLGKDFKNIEVYVPALTAAYKNFTVVLDISYSVDLTTGGYGKIYLNVTEIGGAAVSAKVYCDVSETVEAVMNIIDMFNKKDEPAPASTYAADGKDVVAQIIGTVVSIDFKALINEFTADGTGINLNLNADEILKLLNINLKGIELGSAVVSVGFEEGGLTVNGGLKDLGLTLGVSGSGDSIPALNKGEYADLTSYLNGVYNLLNSNTFSVTLGFNGSECSLTEYVKDVTANTTAQVKLSSDFKTVTVNAPLTVKYGETLSVELEVYYTVEIGSGYGKAYITLTKINEQEFSARVWCDVREVVSAVEELIALFGNGSQPEAAAAVADVVDKVVSVDFAKIITLLTADNTGVNLTVNADELLSALNVSLKGVQFGEVELQLGIDENKCATLSGSVPELGLTLLKLNGSDKEIPEISAAQYFDLVELINLVNTAAVEVKEIIAEEAVTFDLAASLTVDGIKTTVAGGGQVIWKGGAIRFAADLTLTLAEGEASETVGIKFVYDETAEHLVRFTVNDIGLVIDRGDINNLSDGVGKIIEVIKSVLGGNAQTAVYEEKGEDGGEASDTLNTILNTVLGFASKLKIELRDADDGSVKNLIISYAENGVLSLGTNGGLNLSLFVQNNNGTEIADINASVHAPAADEDKFTELNGQFDNKEFYAFSEVYDYIFAVLKDLTVKELLGSDTYTLTVNVDGNASGIPALEGIFVNAELYYTETEADDGVAVNKLVEIELNLVIGETDVVASAYYYDGYFYVALRKIGETYLYNTYTDEENYKPLAFKASREEIYVAAETLVKIITSDNASAILSLFNKNTAAAMSESGEIPAAGNNTQLTKIIDAIFKLAISFQREGEENTLTLNIDGLLAEFNVGVSLGEIKVAVNPKTHEINAAAVKDGKSWLKLNAFADAESRHGKAPVKDDYIDIDFVATLLGDLETALNSLGKREDGKTDLRISLTGNLNVQIAYSVVKATIPVNDVKLTAGLDEKDEFFFTLTGRLDKRSAEIGFSLGNLAVITQAWNISVTYSNGYITMGRQLGTADEKFKVMTVGYLLDNILDKNNSPVRWLLGTSDTVWGLICDNVKLDINSGLTTVKDYYLYEHITETPDDVPEEDAKAAFVLASILNGMGVNIGDYSSVFGNEASSVKSQLGLTDNYYAFDLNLSSLIGNTFSKMYAAIVRDTEKGGLKGVKAYAAISADGSEVVKITANLDGGMITAETDTAKHAADYFKTVTAANGNIQFTYDDGTKKFGCYNTEDQSYNYSDYATDYILNVYDFGGADYKDCPMNEKAGVLNKNHSNVKLKSGATVYLLEDYMWLDEEQTVKLVYVDDKGNDLGLSFKISANTNVYMMLVGESKVHFYDSDKNACNVTGSEDNSAVLYAGDALPDPQSLTVEKDGKNYSFAGWYTEGYAELVTSVQSGVDEYFAKYVLTTVTEDNGVIYTFIRNANEENGGHYAASGFNTAHKDSVDYFDAANTLILSNVIGEYKVTEIAAEAFASLSLKNVVVPDNIVLIGEKAFLNNYGIQSVVFLAPRVGFCGSAMYNNTSVPFAGCSAASGGETTVLNLYFNEIYQVNDEGFDTYSKNNRPYWSLFMWKSSNKPRFIMNNGGSLNGHWLNSNGQLANEGAAWAYVDFTVNNFAEDLPKLTGGIITEIFDINEYVVDILNKKTQSVYLYGYNVELSHQLVLDGTRYTVGVTITEEETERWYTVTANAKFEDNTADLAVVCKGENFLKAEDGTLYVKVGETLEIRPVGKYVFDKYESNADLTLTADENGYYVFAMVNQPLNIDVVYKKKPITEITVKSMLTAEYNGFELNAEGLTVNVSATGETELAEPAVANYVFLGWAYDYDTHGSLMAASASFNRETVVSEVYYALWAVARADEINEIAGSFTAGLTNPNGADNGVTVTVNSETASGFEGWYAEDDLKFNNKLEKLTLDFTVLKARLIYSVTATFEASNTWLVYNRNKDLNEPTVSSNDGQIMGNKDSRAEQKFELCEGQTFNVSRKWTNALIIEVLNTDGSQADHYLYFAYYKKALAINYSKRDILENVNDSHYIEFTDGNWNNYSGNAITNNVKIAESGQDHLFGTCSGNGNYTFTIHF